jgi:organic hydroperoxide reductase OsmC/OhrA
MSSTIHRYQAACAWEGSTGLGYERYARSHQVSIGPQRLTVSSDVAFRGDPAQLNPEQLLLTAAVSCQLLSFLAVAARARLDVLRYRDEAVAEMPERPRGTRIERIWLRPEILLASSPPGGERRVRALVEQAHRECYIANTLGCEVSVEPRIAFAAG